VLQNGEEADTMTDKQIVAASRIYREALHGVLRCERDPECAEELAAIASGVIGREVWWVSDPVEGARLWDNMQSLSSESWRALDNASVACDSEHEATLLDLDEDYAAHAPCGVTRAVVGRERRYATLAVWLAKARWDVLWALRDHLWNRAACELLDYAGLGIAQIQALVALSRYCFAAWSSADSVILCPPPSRYTRDADGCFVAWWCP
jgi:hypothetical protein